MTETTTPTPAAVPALRADAERNRLKLLKAAAELFADRGLDVTLDDIARQAGVGVGTAYRRFPNKDVLIDQLMEQRLGQLVDLAEEGLEHEDALAGIRHYLEGAVELQLADRGLKQILFSEGRGAKRVAAARARLAPAVTRLVERAKRQGSIRQDVQPSDVPLIVLMLSTVVDLSRDHEPGLHRRYLELLLHGLTPDAPTPAQRPIDLPRFQRAMAEFTFRRR